MEHYKYIHIFWHDDLKFNPRIVEMINDTANGFCVAEHLFVTPFPRVFDALKNYKNVVLFETDDPYNAKIVNQYAPYCDWIFVNCMPDWLNTLKIKRKYQSKIIWRTWGQEFRFADKDGEILQNYIKKAVRYLLRQEVRRFRAVGVANIVDELDIRDRFGDVKTIRYPYPIRESNLEILKQQVKEKKSSDPYCVMVGHSGHPVDNHIEVLRRLEKFQSENICIYIAFSYGNEEYMTEVRKYVQENWNDKVVIIDQFLPYPKFAELCAKMDAVILDGIQSYALGNVEIFLELQKKFFLNRNGQLHRAFDHERLPHYCTDGINEMSFGLFVAEPAYEDMEKSSLLSFTYQEAAKQWHTILDSLGQ